MLRAAEPVRTNPGYKIALFYPVTGERTDAPAITTDVQGECRCEPPKHGHDWVVLLSRK